MQNNSKFANPDYFYDLYLKIKESKYRTINMDNIHIDIICGYFRPYYRYGSNINRYSEYDLYALIVTNIQQRAHKFMPEYYFEIHEHIRNKKSKRIMDTLREEYGPLFDFSRDRSIHNRRTVNKLGPVYICMSLYKIHGKWPNINEISDGKLKKIINHCPELLEYL